MKTGFFQEAPGEYSIMRLGFGVLVLWFIILSGYITFTNSFTVVNVSFLGTYLTVLLGAKALQRKFEN